MKECAWCGKQFVPTRFDQRFDSRECLDRYFSREKQQAVALLRAMQRGQKIFQVNTTSDLCDDEMQPYRRRA